MLTFQNILKIQGKGGPERLVFLESYAINSTSTTTYNNYCIRNMSYNNNNYCIRNMSYNN